MNPEKMIEAIKKHQANPYVHPLTCGNDNRHQNLEPHLDDTAPDGVVLLCPDCDYRQTNIPFFALHTPPTPSFFKP